MQYVVAKIKRDTNTVHHKSVPMWEIPLLEFVFEDGNVELTDELEDVPGMEYPDPAFEFDRLTRAYGSDSKSGVPHVVSIYGNANAGVRALAKAMAEAKAAERPISAAAKPKRKVRAAEHLDALLG
jgi:hypothetical protein